MCGIGGRSVELLSFIGLYFGTSVYAFQASPRHESPVRRPPRAMERSPIYLTRRVNIIPNAEANLNYKTIVNSAQKLIFSWPFALPIQALVRLPTISSAKRAVLRLVKERISALS